MRSLMRHRSTRRSDMTALSRGELSYSGSSPKLSLHRNREARGQRVVAFNVTPVDLPASPGDWPRELPPWNYTAGRNISTTSVTHEHNPGTRTPPRASTEELCLYPLALTLCLVLIAVLAMLFATKSAPKASGKDVEHRQGVCTTNSCYRDAEFLDGLLSWYVDDPCDNFHPFVCRRWSSKLPNTPLTHSVSPDDAYVTAAERWVFLELRKLPRNHTLIGPLRNLIDKCLDVRAMEDSGWSFFFEFMFNTSLEAFPLTPPLRRSLDVWRTAATLLRKTGTAALLNVGVASHPSVGSRDVPLVTPPETLTAGGADIDEVVRMYTGAVLSVIKDLNKDFVPPAHMQKIVEFAKAIEMANKVGSKTYSNVRFMKAQPELVEFLSEAMRGLPSMTFTEGDRHVWVQAGDAVSKIVELVRNAERHVVLNFLCVRLIAQASAFVPVSNGVADLYTTLTYGKFRTSIPRWKLCLRAAEKAVFPLFYSFFLSKLRLRDRLTVARLSALVADVANNFANGIDTSPHFDNNAKAAIGKIISGLKLQIISPQWLTDSYLLMKYTDNLRAMPNAAAFETYVALHERTFLEMLLHGSSNRWIRSAFSTSCWYQPDPQTLYVPALLFNVTLGAGKKLPTCYESDPE
ncbi:hypothetical protein HPB48_019728 [Haemaphysalis longicornis]|uniref:Peptidase M13 N-terminal domain-containing protein n=1 Tax=Haemaphysalis longicornis TaxID=44386 RepID=A0A9J6G8P0_HAELO|nr:hypothetical protein HPB48_019728 [Haemaphysalis longicornis]